jgi:hypothetical protein
VFAMMMFESLLFVATASIAAAQFVPAPTDLISTTGFLDISVRYKQVPTGICELNPNVKRSVNMVYSNNVYEIGIPISRFQ